MIFRLALALLTAAACGTGASAQELPQAITPRALEEAQPITVESLGTPVRTTRRHNEILVPAADGESYHLLLFYRQGGEPAQVFIVDLASGEVDAHRLPPGYSHPWSHRILDDGRVFMTHWSPAAITIYDPATKQFTDMGSIAPDRATEAIALGTDGMLYVSTFSKAHALQINPETLEVTDYGPQGPAMSSIRYGYSIAADDEYVYTATGQNPWVLAAHNKTTGEQTAILEGPGGDHISVGQSGHGVTARHADRSGDEPVNHQYWLYQGKAISVVEGQSPPWPVPANDTAAAAARKPAPPKPDLLLDRAQPGADGVAEVWYRTAAARAALPSELPDDATPQQQGWQRVTLNIEVTPIEIIRVHELADGRLFGSAASYQGMFIYDPATNTHEHVGRIPLSHYGTALVGGKVYMTGYPSSPIYEWDPNQPWTFEHGLPGQPAPAIDQPQSNPQRVIYMRPLLETHHLRHAATGADGQVYVGGHAERSHVGGGLGWWNPQTREAGGLREPFELYDVAWLCAADSGQRIVYSSQTVADPGRDLPAPAQAKLFIYDIAEQRLIHAIEPMPNLRNTGMVAAGTAGKVIAAAQAPDAQNVSLLYQVDLNTGEVDFMKQVPGSFGGDFRVGPDGMIWTFLSGALVRIDPNDDAAIHVVGKVQGGGGRIAFVGQDIYLSGKTELRRLSNVVPSTE